MKDGFAEHIRTVQATEAQINLLEAAARRIIESFEAGGRLFLLGNGGSAADAQHIAAEMVGRFKKNRRALPAMALSTDSSILTAVSNDLDFEKVFSRQVQALVRTGDIVWALSVSGASRNILNALHAAREAGAVVVGFTGSRGTAMRDLCDLCFQVPHSASDRVQEVHQLAYHLVCEAVENHFAGAE